MDTADFEACAATGIVVYGGFGAHGVDGEDLGMQEFAVYIKHQPLVRKYFSVANFLFLQASSSLACSKNNCLFGS
jgi:hypothetical protein